jgi:glycosyltransferase involved in cell wall biosynthesis
MIEQNRETDKIIVFSEKDSGLYNAMNQAMDKCSGDYILFLNSGDTLADALPSVNIYESCAYERVSL